MIQSGLRSSLIINLILFLPINPFDIFVRVFLSQLHLFLQSFIYSAKIWLFFTVKRINCTCFERTPGLYESIAHDSGQCYQYSQTNTSLNSTTIVPKISAILTTLTAIVSKQAARVIPNLPSLGFWHLRPSSHVLLLPPIGTPYTPPFTHISTISGPCHCGNDDASLKQLSSSSSSGTEDTTHKV